MRGSVGTCWGRVSYCSAGPAEQAGPGWPAIVLLHAPQLGHTAFAPLVTRLGQDFQVVTVDSAGPGPADARAIAETLQSLGLNRVVLYGVHVGASQAIRLGVSATATGWPHLDGLVLSGVLDEDGQAQHRLAAISVPVLLLSNPFDPLFGSDRRLARKVPRTRQVIIRSGRLPAYWARPDVVAQEITTVALGGRELPILSSADFL